MGDLREVGWLPPHCEPHIQTMGWHFVDHIMYEASQLYSAIRENVKLTLSTQVIYLVMRHVTEFGTTHDQI